MGGMYMAGIEIDKKYHGDDLKTLLHMLSIAKVIKDLTGICPESFDSNGIGVCQCFNCHHYGTMIVNVRRQYVSCEECNIRYVNSIDCIRIIKGLSDEEAVMHAIGMTRFRHKDEFAQRIENRDEYEGD